MNTSVATAESEAYLAAVTKELDDLAEEDRRNLVEDLAQHLAEVSADVTDQAPRLEMLLGRPDQYAAELRAAAGLPPRSAPTVTHEPYAARLSSLGAVRIARKVWRHPIVASVLEFLLQLRPAWWVVRGYLLVAVPALWSPNSTSDFPIPSINGSHLLGLAATVGAIVGSVALGKRSLSRGLRLVIGLANLVLAFFAVSLIGTMESRLSSPAVMRVKAAVPSYELQSPHGPVTNIFPYSADGAPLEDVLLFDQDGRPLRTAKQLWWPDGCRRVVSHPRAADGVEVQFSYPKDYVAADNPGRACDARAYRPEVPLPLFAMDGAVVPQDSNPSPPGPESPPPVP